MGSTRPEREYVRALDAYLAAARDLVRAMAEWEAARVPLLPGADGELEEWTPHQIRVTVAAALAWRTLTVRRKELDACARVPGARAPVSGRGPEPGF